MSDIIDLTGKKIGRLTIVSRAENSSSGHTRWNCVCECGNALIVVSQSLRTGRTKTCGCRDQSVHGCSSTRLYNVWRGMKQRCSYERGKTYKDYGARGISVCDEWKNDFTAFRDWALENGYNQDAPYGGCTLDRINVDGNYEPSNCRWISMKEQSSNKTNNRLISSKGEKKPISEWEREKGIQPITIWSRLNLGWSEEDAINTPVKTRNKKGIENDG